MKYRTLGRTGEKISALAFGAMRLPLAEKPDTIDEPASIEMMRYAVDQGVNYIDSAYVYQNGASERVVGKTLLDGYRSKVSIATKAPVWNAEKTADFDRFLDEQLERLQTDHIEFYLLHCLTKSSWPKMKQLDVFSWAEQARADGRIGYFGFSFHDSLDVFKEIVDGYDWDFCQIQYNLVNEDVQAGTEGLKYAAGKGLGVIIMEPLFGGGLAVPPPEIQELWQVSGFRPADVALRWLWDKPEVSVVLSGMNTMGQVRENIESAERAAVGALAAEERDVVRCVQEKYRELSPVPCTKCGYCMPCPHGVDIPRNIELLNDATVFKGNSAVLCQNIYNSLPEQERAGACQVCGECEERCPQGIEISSVMKKVVEQFG